MLDWIKRQPVKFGYAVEQVVATLLIYLAASGLEPGLASGIKLAVGAILAFVTAAVVVPNVKLPESTIERAANMDKADIAKVEAVKVEAKS